MFCVLYVAIYYLQLSRFWAKPAAELDKRIRESGRERARDPISKLSIFSMFTINLNTTVLLLNSTQYNDIKSEFQVYLNWSETIKQIMNFYRQWISSEIMILINDFKLIMIFWLQSYMIDITCNPISPGILYQLSWFYSGFTITSHLLSKSGYHLRFDIF